MAIYADTPVYEMFDYVVGWLPFPAPITQVSSPPKPHSLSTKDGRDRGIAKDILLLTHERRRDDFELTDLHPTSTTTLIFPSNNLTPPLRHPVSHNSEHAPYGMALVAAWTFRVLVNPIATPAHQPLQPKLEERLTRVASSHAPDDPGRSLSRELVSPLYCLLPHNHPIFPATYVTNGRSSAESYRATACCQFKVSTFVQCEVRNI